MEPLFTWLHVSDLCCRAAGSDAQHERLLAVLQRDLADRAEKPDAMVVSGDVAASGAREEYVAARRWLLDTARAVGLGPERVFLVPGNHDVDRRLPIDPRFFAELREGRRSLDAALDRRFERSRLTERLAAFAEMAQTFGPARAPQERLESAHALNGREGLRVHLVGLCSAYLSLDDEDHGALRLGAGQLERAGAVTEPGELVIAVMHHPLHSGWLADEAEAASSLIEHAHVLLTGHVHDGDAEAARGGIPLEVVWIAAGSSLAPPEEGESWRRQGWSSASVVRLPTGSMAVRVAPRRWSTSRRRFLPDERVLRDGRPYVDRALRFTLRQLSSAPPPPPPRTTPATPPTRTPVPPSVHTPPSTRTPAPPAARTPAPPLARPAERGVFEGPGAFPAAPVPYFGGREAELCALREMLASPAVSCVVITGPGGAGKSALVQQLVAGEAREAFDESAWIDARDLAAEIGRVARRFGFRGDEREAGRYLARALETRRVLLVIDDIAPGMADVRALPLPGPASRSRAVITSRILTLHEDLGRARALRIGTWDLGTSRAYLRESVPELADERDEAIDALSRRVGGLPLAVRLLARQLLRPGVTASVLLGRLDREPLSALDAGARGAERTIAATFQPSVDGLGEIERRVLVALAVCGPATRAAVVAAVAGVREDAAQLALEGLAEQSLVEWLPDEERPFRLHQVVRMLLASRPEAADAEGAHEIWAVEHLDANRAPEKWQELWREAPEILAVIDRRVRAGYGAAAWDLLSALVPVLDRRGMYEEIVAHASRVLAALPPDSSEAAAVLAHLGLAWCSLGQATRAIGELESALAIAEKRRWPEGQGLALGGLGRCYAALGDFREAAACHERAAAIHESLGLRRAFASDLGNLGLAYRRLGDVPGAIERLERALALQEELDLRDGRAEVLGGLGLCFRDIGEHASAVEYFERALALHEELGQRAGQATMLGNLGNAHRALGDLPRAIDHLGRALAIYEELGLLEGQATALGNLGASYRALGDPARAREHFDRALAALRKLQLPDDHPHVRMVTGALAKLGR